MVLLLAAGTGCSDGAPDVVPRPTATPLPVASLAGLEVVEQSRAGTSRCVIGDAGDADLVEVALTKNDDGLTGVSWSGAAEAGGDAELGWYLLATAAEGEAAFEVGATSTPEGVTAFIVDVNTGQIQYLTGADIEGEAVTVADGQIAVSLDPKVTPGLDGAVEWSATATVDGRPVYSCLTP